MYMYMYTRSWRSLRTSDFLLAQWVPRPAVIKANQTLEPLVVVWERSHAVTPVMSSHEMSICWLFLFKIHTKRAQMVVESHLSNYRSMRTVLPAKNELLCHSGYTVLRQGRRSDNRLLSTREVKAFTLAAVRIRPWPIWICSVLRFFSSWPACCCSLPVSFSLTQTMTSCQKLRWREACVCVSASKNKNAYQHPWITRHENL